MMTKPVSMDAGRSKSNRANAIRDAGLTLKSNVQKRMNELGEDENDLSDSDEEGM